MLLGTLITRLADERYASETLDALGDIVLYAEVAAAAEHFEETPGEYLAASVGEFAMTAGDEEWVSLLATMERNPDDPGRAAIRRILRWAMLRDPVQTTPSAGACSCTS